MWDNSAPGAKKNPKGPDFKCKDKECNHAVWLPKPKKTLPAPVTPTPHSNDSYKTMVLSYCKDIVCAEIAKGEVKEPFKRVADGYKVLLSAYAYPFGKPTPPPTPPPATFGEEEGTTPF